MKPGEILAAEGDLQLNVGRATVTLSINNAGDRPVQVGSHYHFFEVNPSLDFDHVARFHGLVDHHGLKKDF